MVTFVHDTLVLGVDATLVTEFSGLVKSILTGKVKLIITTFMFLFRNLSLLLFGTEVMCWLSHSE